MPGTLWSTRLFAKHTLGPGSASCGPPPGFVNKVLSLHSHSRCCCAGTTELRGCDIDPVAHKPETSTLWLATESLPHARQPCVGRGGQGAEAYLPVGCGSCPRGLCGLREGATCQNPGCPMGVQGWETEPGWALTPPSPAPSNPWCNRKGADREERLGGRGPTQAWRARANRVCA